MPELVCGCLVPGQCTFTSTSLCIQLASEPWYASNLPAVQYARDENLSANVLKR